MRALKTATKKIRGANISHNITPNINVNLTSYISGIMISAPILVCI